MPQVIWVLLVGTALTASGFFYAQILTFTRWHPWDSQLLNGCSAAFVILVAFIFLKSYCTTWRNISKNSFALLLYEHLCVPIMVLSLPIFTVFHGAHFDGVARNGLGSGEKLLLLLAFVILMDISGFLRRIFNENWTLATGSESQGLSGAFTQNLFVRYPPQTRGDMWAIDFLVNGIWILMFVIHFA